MPLRFSLQDPFTIPQADGLLVASHRGLPLPALVDGAGPGQHTVLKRQLDEKREAPAVGSVRTTLGGYSGYGHIVHLELGTEDDTVPPGLPSETLPRVSPTEAAALLRQTLSMLVQVREAPPDFTANPAAVKTSHGGQTLPSSLPVMGTVVVALQTRFGFPIDGASAPLYLAAAMEACEAGEKAPPAMDREAVLPSEWLLLTDDPQVVEVWRALQPELYRPPPQTPLPSAPADGKSRASKDADRGTATSPPPRRVSVARKASRESADDAFERELLAARSRTTWPYAAGATPTDGDILAHPTLGEGVIRKVRGGKWDVVFRSGPRTLSAPAAVKPSGG